MTILRSVLLEEAGFSHALPERGVLDADLLGAVGKRAVVQVKQVHGSRAIMAEDAPGQEADAIVARANGGLVAVGVRVADCVPVLIADESSGDVAAVHAGWRGVVAGVVESAIARLGGGRIIAAIGPCIGPCCFEVGGDVADAIAQASPGPDVVVRRLGEKAFVDLRLAVRSQLLALLGPNCRIEDVGGCTMHEPERFHSFRREGANSGRMLAAIATRPER